MAELIATIILASSLLGILMILFRKIPVLIELPEVVEKAQKETLTFKFKEKIRNILPSRIILQKILSHFRILTLKTEKGTDNLLQKLRKKSKEEIEKIDKEEEEFQELINQK